MKATITIIVSLLLLASMSIVTWVMVDYWYRPAVEDDRVQQAKADKNIVVTSLCILTNCTMYNSTCTHTNYVSDDDGYKYPASSYQYVCTKIRLDYKDNINGLPFSDSFEVSPNTSESMYCALTGNKTCYYCAVDKAVYSYSPYCLGYDPYAGNVLFGTIALSIIGWIIVLTIVGVAVYMNIIDDSY